MKHFCHFRVYSFGRNVLFIRTMVMKTLATFLVLLAIAGSSFAQFDNSRTLINRVDRQVAEPSRIEHRVTSVAASGQKKTFSIVMDEPRIEIGSENYGSITGLLTNTSSDSIRLIFHRQQNRDNKNDILEDTGWSTGVCFGTTCYLNSVSSIPPEQAFVLGPGGTTEFKLAVSTNLEYDDSIVVSVLLTDVSGTSDDTIGLWMSAVYRVEGSVSIENQVRRSTIRSVFPSPLMSGSSINVNVESVLESAYRYSIYDPFGREVAFGTSQRRLLAGMNQLSISSLEGLNSGSYLLKLSFSDGSSDAYPFTVLR